MKYNWNNNIDVFSTRALWQLNYQQYLISTILAL